MKNLLLLALLGTFTLSAPYAAAQSAPMTPSKPPMTAADMDMMQMMMEQIMRHQLMMQAEPEK